jgi:hypothetical protein
MPDETPPRPGYRTSEYWLALATVIVGALLASGAIGDTTPLGKALAFIASALASAGYSYSRAVVKTK